MRKTLQLRQVMNYRILIDTDLWPAIIRRYHRKSAQNKKILIQKNHNVQTLSISTFGSDQNKKYLKLLLKCA